MTWIFIVAAVVIIGLSLWRMSKGHNTQSWNPWGPNRK